MYKRLIPLLVLALVAACGPRIRPLVPVMDNGEVLDTSGEETVARAAEVSAAERASTAAALGEIEAEALASCTPETCAAIARGEVALGMTPAEVLAATRTTWSAWETRGASDVTVMTGRLGAQPPSDAVGPLAFVSLQDGAVRSYTYSEPQGFRTVNSLADATTAGRADAQAEALLREGDQYTVAGRLDLALARYDQADILRPGDPQTTLRIARTLDKQLRPIEAVLRYRMFIHQMELEKIRARGEVAANVAEAIARAHERIVVIEKR
ncbi:MAG TPA: hypothetical protein VFI91_09845 [Longimicrobiaceae bacterium]|nr:hypothetical protein [Longimicrobiaceae bacterium]